MQIIECWIRRKREIENWESRQRFILNPWRHSRYYLMHLPKLECSDIEIRSIPRSWRCSRNSRDFKIDSAHSNCGVEERVEIPSTPEIITLANSRLIYFEKLFKKIEINFMKMTKGRFFSIKEFYLVFFDTNQN